MPEKLDVREYNAVNTRIGQFKSLDVLVHCQGIARPGAEWEEEAFLNIMDINLNSAMRLACVSFPLLKASGGNIVNVASYTTSKTGIVDLIRAMAHKYDADGVRVNSTTPGYRKTDMIESLWTDPEAAEKIANRAAAKRWGTVEDLVGPTLYLASDAAALATGITLPVDDGYYTG